MTKYLSDKASSSPANNRNYLDNYDDVFGENDMNTKRNETENTPAFLGLEWRDSVTAAIRLADRAGHRATASLLDQLLKYDVDVQRKAEVWFRQALNDTCSAKLITVFASATVVYLDQDKAVLGLDPDYLTYEIAPGHIDELNLVMGGTPRFLLAGKMLGDV